MSENSSVPVKRQLDTAGCSFLLGREGSDEPHKGVAVKPVLSIYMPPGSELPCSALYGVLQTNLPESKNVSNPVQYTWLLKFFLGLLPQSRTKVMKYLMGCWHLAHALKTSLIYWCYFINYQI